MRYIYNCLTIYIFSDNINLEMEEIDMANLTTAINVNVDTKVKEEATSILKSLGLNMSTAINMFLAQVVKRDGIPFEVVNPKPSKELLEALQEGALIEKEIREGKRTGYRNASEMLGSIIDD